VPHRQLIGGLLSSREWTRLQVYLKKRPNAVNKSLSNIYKLNSDEKAYIFIPLHFLFL